MLSSTSGVKQKCCIIEDQIVFLQKYVATTRQKIAYFIDKICDFLAGRGSVPSEKDEIER